VLVDANTYLLELTRYIHLNPVRAGMVKEPGRPIHGAGIVPILALK
jgi:hypothetical protein